MRRFEYVYSFAPMRPPRVSVTTFTSYICCIYTLKFGQYWTLPCVGSSSVSSMPCMQFLFVRPRLCRGLPSDSTSRWTPLPVANSSYCQVCSGLSPPSDSACRAHNKKECCGLPATLLWLGMVIQVFQHHQGGKDPILAGKYQLSLVLTH